MFEVNKDLDAADDFAKFLTRTKQSPGRTPTKGSFSSHLDYPMTEIRHSSEFSDSENGIKASDSDNAHSHVDVDNGLNIHMYENDSYEEQMRYTSQERPNISFESNSTLESN